MSSNRTRRMELVRWESLAKVAALWGVTAGLLGAHHRTPRPDSQVQSPDSLDGRSMLAGYGSQATTGREWSPTRSFHLIPAEALGRWTALDSLERQTVLKLNRIDARHLRRRDLIVPDSVGDELGYAPFPDSVTALAGIPKFVAVSRRVQAFAAYEYGRLVRWGPTSTGKQDTPTDSGLVFTNWRSRSTVSTEDPAWKLNWYFNLMAIKGVAFHEYELPGRPASHGCVRLLETDARWMFGWADEWVPGRGSDVKRYGTPVLIFGDWDYALPAPWLGLADGDARARVSEWELAAALAPNLQTVLGRAVVPATQLAAVEAAAPRS